MLEHTHLKMSSSWVQNDYPPPLPPSSISSPYSTTTASFTKDSSPSSSGSRISPAVLFVIVILAVLFFISGLLHLLVRFLVKHPTSSASSQSNRHPEISGSDALQRQLQQLFHLHDSGLDQAFIDALPVFQYKEIVGLKEPFDCAVCLCEFSDKDKLRLLPMCSHAFHINCIDTWLLSNSTCPLCRGTLFSPAGFSMENPMFDIDDLRGDDGCPGNGGNGFVPTQKTLEIDEIVVEKGVLPVRLGKFRKLNGEAGDAGGETSSSNLDVRRCFSMGSYQYVLVDTDLRVALGNEPHHHDIMHSRGAEQNVNLSVDRDLEENKNSSLTKGESFSVSKIWLWRQKGKFSSSSDSPMGTTSSFNVNLPWMDETQGK
ncbi:RING-H2 FINGER PROTEIN ATL46-LIKE [Salix koriyanagi]|uniref:RING-type E3 ubiquitin transferase n=1 Tax=Salix koriyanagi TaxID=2511006 RepID=A0A9Q0PNK9_9ROSI|nr:RING-H2 FINGER PROTEIN ATL46-LIKE [Salix koriyanagi]KAJ6691421.1 RING-H2 FINGER PROTEIN ATL46-LIKE [Salix koriyanagi]